MKLAKSCVINATGDVSLVLGHLAYAAWKLWNVANYERKTKSREFLIRIGMIKRNGLKIISGITTYHLSQHRNYCTR
ncbi:hypothetical protein JCM17380_40170 [Desulfosporosinus burensis]